MPASLVNLVSCRVGESKFCGKSLRPRSSKPATLASRCDTTCLHEAPVNSGEAARLGPSQILRSCGLALAGAAVTLAPLFSNGNMAALANPAMPNPAISELAALTAGDPEKDPRALLRAALPFDNPKIRQCEASLMKINDDLKVPGVRFSGVSQAVRNCSSILARDRDAILKAVAPANRAGAVKELDQLDKILDEFADVVDKQKKELVQPYQRKALDSVGRIELAMINGFPFEIPAKYKDMPLLKGRAQVEIKLRFLNNPTLDRATVVLTVDGLNAPVTGGNFIDLVKRGFYNNVEIQRADGFVVQFGKPEGSEGFEVNGKVRTIPLEVRVERDKAPIYEDSLEELGRFRERTVLPFNAYGTTAMAREEFDNNSASSQVFWLLKESELTPSQANILDGRYAVFGYLTENEELCGKLSVGDIIESMKVVQGEEFFVPGK
eukprot:jgi/Mesvir1/6071/Mv00799-RA.1